MFGFSRVCICLEGKCVFKLTCVQLGAWLAYSCSQIFLKWYVRITQSFLCDCRPKTAAYSVPFAKQCCSGQWHRAEWHIVANLAPPLTTSNLHAEKPSDQLHLTNLRLLPSVSQYIYFSKVGLLRVY